MADRSKIFTLGFIWDITRFFLLFAFLAGNRGTSILEGNFLILLLGISGQPVVSFLWRSGDDRISWAAPVLAVSRIPGIIIEFLAVLFFFTGRLPDQGEVLLIENIFFPGGIGLLLLLFLFLIDVVFEFFLLSFKQKES